MPASELSRLFLEGLVLATTLALPLLAAALAASVANAVVQRLLRVNEPALGVVPRLLIVGAVLLSLAPWTAARLTAYATRLWSLFPGLIG